MADINKAALRNRVLQHLGVIAASETPATADQTLVEEMIDAAWERLRKLGLVPFATSANPSWAQVQLRDIVAYDVGPSYGMTGQRLLELRMAAERAEIELRRQLAGFKHNVSIEAKYY